MKYYKGDVVVTSGLKPYPFTYLKRYLSTHAIVYSANPFILVLDGFHYTSKIKKRDVERWPRF